MLNLANPSRIFNQTRHQSQFWGHDSAMQWSFFVTEGALKRLQPNVERSEASCCSALILIEPLYTPRAKRLLRAARRCGLFFSAGLRRTELRELLVGSVFPQSFVRARIPTRNGALFFLFFSRLWFFLLAIASQLALCHLVLPSLALDAAFSLPARHRCTCRAV